MLTLTGQRTGYGWRNDRKRIGDVKEGDAIVIISFWRLYNSAIRAARKAKERGARCA